MSTFQTHTRLFGLFNNFCDLAWFLMLICWVSFIRVVQKGMKIPTSLFFNQNNFFCTFSLISLFSSLHPGLPSWEKSAEVFGVHGLLDEQVDLSSHAEHRSLFHSLELLLQPQQHPLRHLVEALTVTAVKNMRGRDWTHTQNFASSNSDTSLLDYLDLRLLSMSSPPIVELSVALSSCCSSCCR